LAIGKVSVDISVHQKVLVDFLKKNPLKIA